jgi:divalent metal cation (Fe/Co/Zn/Cd) transporter
MTDTLTITPSSARTARLQRRVRLLVGGVLVYNSLEALIALTAGAVASSTALIGFGLDSIIEVTSALAISWQYAHHTPADREHRALRIIAGSFFALAAYVTFDALTALAGAHEPEHSLIGIILTAVSLVIMPVVSYAERRTGRELGSASVIADSKQTLLCSYLSAVVLGGLVLNSALGWSWADPIAGLAIAALAVREGREALRGDVCCSPPSLLLTTPDDERDSCCDTEH